jgi:hypothetical protein
LFGDHAVDIVGDALLPGVFNHESEVLGKILLVIQTVKSVHGVLFSRLFKFLVGIGIVFWVHRKSDKRLLLERNVDHVCFIKQFNFKNSEELSGFVEFAVALEREVIQQLNYLLFSKETG